MVFKLTTFAALTALASAHPWLQVRQSSSNSSSNLTEFITSERAIALTGAVANIGGTNNSVVLTGVHNQTGNQPLPGVVVASPSTFNPDYYYTWTRDSALTMLMFVDELVFGTNMTGNNSLQIILEDYILAQAALQTVTNPSGTFYPAGRNLGEPKFYTNLTRFDSAWGRPQNDGPALRASTLMELSGALLAAGAEGAMTTISEVLWPIIHNDLKYVSQYWNTTGYDLWEEVNGNSFFTTHAQHRALAEGALLAQAINETCMACEQASEILCFLGNNNFWNETGNYILANINANQVNRSQINCDPILAAMHNFDISANCSVGSTQPCNSRVLATHKVWVDSFRNLYPINNNATAPNAVLTGRYPEDTYYDGNPWFITTLAAAEVLYDAVAQMNVQGSYTVDNVSLSFFTDLLPNVTEATYMGENLTMLMDAMTTYADGFMALVQNYTVSNGSLSEQINKTTGEQTSASALTWSFAAFVTAAERRAGEYPIPWGANTSVANAANATCSWSYYNATYMYYPAAVAGNVVPEPYNNASGCLGEIIFYAYAPAGGSIYLAGNGTLLNNTLSDPSALFQPGLPGNITKADPSWNFPLFYPPGEVVEYLYVLQNGSVVTPENITRTATAPACGETLKTTGTVSFPTSTAA